MRAATPFHDAAVPGVSRGGTVAPMFNARPRVDRRHRPTPVLAAWCAVGALTVSACSGSDGAAPAAIDAASSSGAVVSSAALAPQAVWGAGRARFAASADDGSLVVATTTAVQRLTVDGAAASIDQLSSGSQPSSIAITADGRLAAVGFNTPAVVRVYVIDESGATATTEHALPAPVRDIHVNGSSLVVDTAIGPWSVSAGSAPVALGDDAGGRSAVLPDGSVVTPIAGTDELRVSDAAGAPTTLPIPLADDTSVIDVHASASGRTLGVTAGAGENLFERQDRIVVLDAATRTTVTAVETGTALDPLQWSVTDEAVVVTDGTTVQVTAFDGTETTLAAPVEAVISRIVATPDGFLTVHADGSLAIWSSLDAPPNVLGGGVPIEHVAVAADVRTLTLVDRLGTVIVRDGADGRPIRSDERFATGELTDVAVAADGRIGVASSLGEVTVLDASLRPQQLLAVADGPLQVDAVAFDPVADTVVAAAAERISESAFDDTVRAWDTSLGTERFQVGGEREDVSGCSFFFGRVRFTADGAFLAVTSHDFSIEVVETATGAVVQKLPGDTTVLDLAFSPDGTQLVATYDDGMVRVWDTFDYSLESAYRGAQGGYFAIAVLPGGEEMATADITGAINVVEIATGTVLRGFQAGAARTGDLVLSPDGGVLAAPTPDGGVGLWSTSDGTQLAVAAGHTGAVTGLAFGPDASWLVTASTDGTVRTWSVDAA
jgi:WD40 repeat protein